jgi:protein-tyrosine phosphatase
MIDLHCHILPGLDDGPRTIEDSLALARAQVDAGVRVVAATPHVVAELPANDSIRIVAAVAELGATLQRHAIPLEVVSGGELGLTRATELTDEELRALCLGAGPWLLVEAPLSASFTGADIVLRHLRERGHQLLIAHPERCPDFQRRPETLRGLVRDGMLVQVTAGALVGQFGASVRRFAQMLVSDGMAHVVASDAHDHRGRPPGLLEPTLSAGYSRPVADWLTDDVPTALLAGLPIPDAPEMLAAPRRRTLSWKRRRP